MSQTASSALVATPRSAAEIAALLSSKTALPAGLSGTLVQEGVALMLGKAARAIAPQAVKGQPVLSALVKIETLAGLSGEIVLPWLALRALNLPKGAQIGVATETLADPIAMELIGAAGLVPTTDEDATVRGVFGNPGGRDLDTLVSGGRIVTLDAGQLTVANVAGQLLTSDVMADRDGALAAIDGIAVNTRAATKTGIGPIAYNTVSIGDHTEFAPTVFVPYAIRRIEVPGAIAHPTPLVESAALASVLPPVPSYAPHFHPEIIAKGILSDVQLESVIYAGEAHAKYLESNPDNPNAAAPRQGILIGHGTGVGKGRIAAGIIADNWAQGRRRHIWFSESARLIADARRDWVALGGKEEDIVDIREIPAEAPMPPFSGIVFSTYASLRTEGENGSRLQQLTEWFGASEDGVIVFDEAQNLRNAKSRGGASWATTGVSRQGEAANDLQAALPNARVTYVSATSATDIASMGFATRLGLWGRGTAFQNANRFFSAMEDGGVNALEMVARDLKAMGLYVAANLSFEGVSYERLERRLTLKERATQDRLADIWTKVNTAMNRALVTTGIFSLPAKITGRTHKLAPIHFSMARSRFFQALLASIKTPMLIEAIREDLKKGHAPIIQMTNTFAANADRAIDEALADPQGDVSTVEATPKDILLAYLREQFPVVKYTFTRQGRKMVATPVTDPATGKPAICSQALAARDQLVLEVEQLDVPEGPLEQLMDAFGPEMIAEVTGRRRRLVPAGPQGGRVLEERLATDAADDIAAFMDDVKPILVFSTAGATGATYSAAKTSRNQRLRRHYLLQPGWRADLALQGMGRSHRSNQAQPPEFVLLTTDLWSDRRMISAVAGGMRSLGALTRGLRQAASQDFFTQDDNLEDEFGEAAWANFVNNLAKNAIQGLSIGQFEKEAGIFLRDPRSHALYRPLPPVRRFLNAMSAMTCQAQAIFGQHYRAELEELKLQAIESGEFDRGIETITPDSLVKLEDAVIYRHARTGGETRLLKMLRVDELDPIAYDDARRRAMSRGNTSIVKSALTGRIAILAFPRLMRGMKPAPTDKVEVITPTGARLRTREEVVREGWVPVDITLAESIWNAELTERGDEEEKTFWVISGAMLPIWDKLPRNRPVVYRMETDEGEQIIGRLVSDNFVDTFLKRVDALTGGGLPEGEVEEALLKGGVATLVNGWVLEGWVSPVTGEARIALTMPLDDEGDFATMIQKSGITRILGLLTTEARFRLPKDDAGRRAALAEILGTAPAVTASVL